MPIFNLLSKNFTYQKKDKLKSRKQMQFLFSKGTAITMHPIRLLYTIEKAEAGIFPNGLLQAGVGAPSRQFRKAVQRNKVKRLLREGYRLEKPNFTNSISLTNAYWLRMNKTSDLPVFKPLDPERGSAQSGQKEKEKRGPRKGRCGMSQGTMV